MGPIGFEVSVDILLFSVVEGDAACSIVVVLVDVHDGYLIPALL